MVQSLGWSNGGSSNDNNNQPMQPFMSAAPNQFLQSFSQPSAPAPSMAPISAPAPQLGSNNIPFPLRVPGQAPTMMQQLQYANPGSLKMAPQPDSPLLSAAKTFYGGVNDVGSLLGTAVGSVLPFGQSNIYSPQGRANLVNDLQNETYNPNTKQWAQTGQDAVNKAQTDIKSGNMEAMAGDLGSSLLNAASVVPIGAGANAAKTAIGVGANAGKDAIQGALKEVAKSGIIGGGFAGASGAAGAMQNNASLPDVLKAGAANVPLGVALGAGLPLAAKGLQVGGAKVAGMAKEAAANSNMEAGFAKVPGGKAPVDAPIEPKQVPQTPQPQETSLAPINKSQPRSVPTNLESPKNLSYADSITPNTKTRGFVKSAQDSKLVSDQAKTGISGTYETKANKALQDSAAIRISKDPVKAHDFALNNKSDEGTATAIALAQQYRKAGQHDLEASLINDKARRLTEAGREVQAASLMDKLSPQGVVSSAAQTIQRYNETAKKPIPELTGAVAKQFGDKADAISKMADGREKNIAINQLKEDAANLIPSKTSDKVITTWKAGLLTSPRTTMRNIVGNAVHGIAETAKDPIAALNDKALALKTGNREMTSTLKGTVSGTAKGAQSAKDIATLGFDPEASVEKYNVNHITWGNNKFEQGLKHYTNIVFRNMGAQDKVFYHSSFARSLYDQAGAEAINAGKKGDAAFIKNLVNNPSERMLTNATKDAQTAVFQNSNAGSRIASAIKKEAEKFPGVKPIVDVVMPFTGVPSSIAGQMIAYSPIGLVKGIAKDAKIFAGKVTKENLPDYQRQASQEVGRGVIGTGLLAIGSYLTAQGLMTGQPRDKAQSDQWQLEGKQANSVMVNGKWRSINSIGPEALILLAGGKFAQGNDAATTAANIGKDFTSQTFLAGVQQPLNALSNPVQYAGSYIPNQAASVIPNIVKDTAKSLDPLQRETSVSGNIGQSTVNALKNSIPGAGQDLPAKRDVLGNPMKQEPSGANAFVDLFNSKTPIKNTVVDELSRLSDVGKSATPSTLSNKQTIVGQKVNLTPQQLDQLEKDTGQPITQQFNQLMQTPEYKGASDDAKKAALDGIVTSVRDSAKLGLANGASSTTDQNSTPNSLIDTTKLTNKAQLTLAKDSFDKSGKSYQVVGDTVLRRGADGTVTATPKIKYDYQVGAATLTQQKTAGDLDGWMKTAQSQVDSINKQLTDPSIDPLEKVTLENTRQSLIDSANKYNGYGGFTKGKSSSSRGSGSSSGSSASVKAAANAVLAATKKTPTQKLPKAPTVRQATYRQVPISSGSKTTAAHKYAPIKVSAKSVKVGKDKSHKANANASPNWVTFKNGTYRNVM